ncbi:MAG: signal peptidase II [Coriobacteriales bacterium]|jgi:signal peptidase II|nr:signal peptidase II [Coriobacteriales bacterium]
MKRRNAFVLFTVLVLVIIALDRFTKILAIEQLTGSDPLAFLPLFLDFALVYNTGGAFGLFAGGGVIFVAVALLAVGVILGYLIKAKELRLLIVITLAMISAGALGNAYDRAMIGAVPDFIHTLFMDFPVFNVADMALTVGEFALIIIAAYYWFGPGKRKETAEVREGASRKNEDESAAAELCKSEDESAATELCKSEDESSKEEA